MRIEVIYSYVVLTGWLVMASWAVGLVWACVAEFRQDRS